LGRRAPIGPIKVLSRLEERPFRGKIRNAFRAGEGRQGASYSHSLNGQIFIQVRDHSGGEKERAPRIFLTLYCGEGQPLRYVS
jgi:hypothetical protein